ncbi:MAG: hypothetical protein ACRC2R_14530 [Xenococcaceae cyanobacterium]
MNQSWQDISMAVVKTKIVESNSIRYTQLDRKPFFPFGLYDVSWEDTDTLEMRLNHLRDIAAAGFNTIYTSAPWSNNYDEYGQFFDEAERLGVYIIGENFTSNVALIDAFKQKPAVLGWSIADDVDNGKHSPEKILNYYRQVKKADPDRITYISGFSDEIGKFARCADVVARQSYPIRAGTETELASVYTEISVARNAIAKTQGIAYANLQVFPWSVVRPEQEKDSRAPNFVEARNMTYQSLLAGVKGIIYYTYHDEVWHLPDHPELWMGIKSLVPELKAIAQFVMTGQFNSFQSEDKSLLAGMWKLPDRTAIVLVNTSYEQPLEIAMSVPNSVKQLQPMFDDRPASITLQGDRLTGSLAPLEVQVYIAGNRG